MKLFAAHTYVSPRTRPLNAEETEVRRISYAIKEQYPSSLVVSQAAFDMANAMPDYIGDCVFIPVPASTGCCTANLTLCLAIAELRRNSHRDMVCNVFFRTRPTESQCARHRQGLGPLTPEAHEIRKPGFLSVPLGPLVFVDNVCTSGSTLRACSDCFWGLGSGLVYADATNGKAKYLEDSPSPASPATCHRKGMNHGQDRQGRHCDLRCAA